MKEKKLTIVQLALLSSCTGSASVLTRPIADYLLANEAAHLATIEVGLCLFCFVYAIFLKVCKPPLKVLIALVIPLALTASLLAHLLILPFTSSDTKTPSQLHYVTTHQRTI